MTVQIQLIFITVDYLEICYSHIFLFRTHRPMSLVDVSGQNRTCLPSTPYQDGGGYLGPPWKVGFSETAGHRERYVSSLKWKSTFCCNPIKHLRAENSFLNLLFPTGF